MPKSRTVKFSQIIDIIVEQESQRGRRAKRVGVTHFILSVYPLRSGKGVDPLLALVKILPSAEMEPLLTAKERQILVNIFSHWMRKLIVIHGPDAADYSRMRYTVRELSGDGLRFALENATRDGGAFYRLAVPEMPNREVQLQAHNPEDDVRPLYIVPPLTYTNHYCITIDFVQKFLGYNPAAESGRAPEQRVIRPGIEGPRRRHRFGGYNAYYDPGG